MMDYRVLKTCFALVLMPATIASLSAADQRSLAAAKLSELCWREERKRIWPAVSHDVERRFAPAKPERNRLAENYLIPCISEESRRGKQYAGGGVDMRYASVEGRAEINSCLKAYRDAVEQHAGDLLFRACKTGDLDDIEAALNIIYDGELSEKCLKWRSLEGSTPLAIACFQNHVDIVALILPLYSDAAFIGRCYRNPRYSSEVKTLLKQHLDKLEAQDRANARLIEACQHKHGDVHLTDDCECDNIATAREAIAAGADPYTGAISPLAVACVFRNLDVVKFLVDEVGVHIDDRIMNWLNATDGGPCHPLIAAFLRESLATRLYNQRSKDVKKQGD